MRSLIRCQSSSSDISTLRSVIRVPSGGLYTSTPLRPQSPTHQARRLAVAIPFWLTKLLIRTRLAGLFPRARRLTAGGTAYLKYYSDRVLTAPVDELLDPAIVAYATNFDVLDLNQ